MIEIVALTVLSAAAVALTGLAINFFWQTGFWPAVLYGSLITGAFLAFWASGIWIGASRHSWGMLAPIFLGLFLVAWVLVYLLIKILQHFGRR